MAIIESLNLNSDRLSQSQKNANNKAWYKHKLDLLESRSFYGNSLFTDYTKYQSMKINYDLYNNILNTKDFEYVCKPFGEEGGELPAKMTNRDIFSRKIKMLEGMELKRPFSWKLVAINPEATTRKETLKFKMIQEFVASEITKQIELEVRKAKEQEAKGKQLSKEEVQQIEQEIQKEVQSMTPDEVEKYIKRKHQDPAEILGNQLLNYLVEKLSLKDKFAKGWKHSMLSATEVYWVGISRGNPDVRVINPLYFDFARNNSSEYIQNSDWAVCEYRMSPSQVIELFGDELTEEEMDQILSPNSFYGNATTHDLEFSFNNSDSYAINTVKVLHGVWKSLRKIGFLTYLDVETGEELQLIVDETYKLNKQNGDIKIEWEWIPEVHEGYKIGTIAYAQMRPLEGQIKSIDNLYECKLPYIGAVVDSLNSLPTSIADRLKQYQYYYNIILYRLELLMASDKGKMLLMNMNMIPESQGIDTKKWLYFTETLKIGFLNPNEEGNRYNDISQAAKEVDMSLASDIKKYVDLAEYIEQKAGEAIGIPKQSEGQIGPNESVTNVKQSVLQTSHILEPYFALHNTVKKEVMTTLLEVAKLAYSIHQPELLYYVTDDNTIEMLKPDYELLENSCYGLFINNASKTHEIKDVINQLAHAAMQNQRIDLSDVVKVLRTDDLITAQEELEMSENKKQKELQQQQMQMEQLKAEESTKQRQHEKEQWEHEKELIILKEEERRKTEIQKQTILSMGFNEDKDVDKDGMPDILEVAKFNLDAEIKANKQTLEKDKLNYQIKKDDEERKLKEKKLEIDKIKAKKSSK